MLILTRNVGTSIMIGDNVEVTILKITGNQIKLGIAAPKRMAVHRKEIWMRIKQLAEYEAANPSDDESSRDLT